MSAPPKQVLQHHSRVLAELYAALDIVTRGGSLPPAPDQDERRRVVDRHAPPMQPGELKEQ